MVGLVLAVLVNISGILGAYMASEWSKVIPALDVSAARDSLIALAVSSLVAASIIMNRVMGNHCYCYADHSYAVQF